MGLSNQLDHCYFHLQPNIPTDKVHPLPEKRHAAYVATHDGKLFYITRSNSTKTKKTSGTSGILVEEIALTEENFKSIIETLGFKDAFNMKMTCASKVALTPKQLSDIASLSGHIHRPAYVKQMVECFKKIKNKDQFSTKDKALYVEAIDLYENFINHFLSDILPAMGVHKSNGFYTKKEFCLANTGEDCGLTLPDEKLNTISNFLTQGDAQIILNGYLQLQRLLSKDMDTVQAINTDLCWKIIHFSNNLQEKSNPYVNFVMGEIRKKPGVTEEIDQGTRQQKILIARLRDECIAYRAHLNKKLKRAPDEITPLASAEGEPLSLLNQKFNHTQSLLNILDDKTIDATKKIKDFEEAFTASKGNLKDHRDNGFALFFKRVSFLLSSLVFGAGLIYSKATKGSCNFFKSHGEIVAENIQNELGNPFYQPKGISL